MHASIRFGKMVVQVGKLKGPFRGFNNRQTRFSFSNWTTWRQDEAKYVYFYAANPRARVLYQENGTYCLEIDGTEETVLVVQDA